MKNLRIVVAIIALIVALGATCQRANFGSALVNYELAKANIPLIERGDLILDNPLGVEIGMVQILDEKGRLIDAAIIQGDQSSIGLKGVYMPTGDYVLVFNTMLGFSFVQEVTRAQF
ncbi:MAG: hypothetical protein HKN45_10145 [Flavobacteriales bacterium]|nr:hypothetical protein [Flavobacteriales bacterium]NNK80211.1 hypothetical protein [Flavobacteriales bacterium]